LTASGENRIVGRGTLVAAVLLCACALLACAIAAAGAEADPTPEAALAELNSWRAEMGESAVASPTVSNWNTGCEHHDFYEHEDNGNHLAHEEPAGPGHTSDGDEAAKNSVLAAAFSTGAPVPDANLLPGPTWDAAVFHRAQLLAPRLAQTGFHSTTFQEGGNFLSFTCMRTLGASNESIKTPGLSLYPSPANGAYAVPTTFPAGTESPDPAKETGVPAGSTLGWLLNVEINGPWESAGSGYVVSAHGVTATLAPDGTMNFVPLVVSECGPSGCGGGGGTADGNFFEGGFGLFPTQALAPNTTYRVALTGGAVTDTHSHVDYPLTGYSWCFSTGASYAVSADCSAPTTAAQEPSAPNASTAPNFTVPASPGGGGAGGTGTTTPIAPHPTAVDHCVVPKLAGKSLKAAKKKLLAADCKLGKVTKRQGSKRQKGKAVHQGAKPGKVLPAGTKIAITVDKG
jgi:hypothetical protein